MAENKIERFDVAICNATTGEVYEIVAATLETTQGGALQSRCEARIVPAGKVKKGDVLGRARCDR